MTHSTEIHTSVAMLISVFGEPTSADSETNNYEWQIDFADGSTAVVRNADTGGSTARVQAWELHSASAAGIAQFNAKLEEGENYYEGALHPELFVKRDA